MKITTNSRFGNFAWEAKAEVSNGQLEQLAAFGLLQVLQRSPSSAAEKKMAGYEKRPEGFSRDSIGYSEAAAEMLAEALGSVEVKEGGKVILSLAPEVSVSEYVAPEGVQSKFTEEKAIVARHESAGDFAQWLKDVVKFDGDAVAEDEKVLRAVRAYKIAALKAM